MTQHTSLPLEDWQSLATLALGTSVVQFGYTDGIDSATLAKSANFVLALIQDPDMDDNGWPSAFEYYNAQVHNEGAGHKVLATNQAFPACSVQWADRTFGLAFVYSPALNRHSLTSVLNEAQRLAETVAVVRDQVPFRIAAVHRAGIREGWSRTVSGELHVLHRAAADRAAYPAVM
jgi:hypothetical protein